MVDVERIINSGAIIHCRTTTPEFSTTSFTHSKLWGVTRNPWNLEYTPGGSSGGSASAVSSGLCLGSTGSDTGGSIRQPASFCGLVGLKPTYGRCSRFGMIAFASSLDQAGPITKTVEDSALMLQAMVSFDKRDSTSSRQTIPDFSDFKKS